MGPWYFSNVPDGKGCPVGPSGQTIIIINFNFFCKKKCCLFQ